MSAPARNSLERTQETGAIFVTRPEGRRLDQSLRLRTVLTIGVHWRAGPELIFDKGGVAQLLVSGLCVEGFNQFKTNVRSHAVSSGQLHHVAVRVGLDERPAVSQYRLGTDLCQLVNSR